MYILTGAKYDLKVVKEQLVPILVELDEVKFVIKRGSSYSCIATERLKFLDVISYVAPGVDLSSFLKAYGANAPKSFFPYEWFTGLDRLSAVIFPEFSDFYSSLKKKNTLIPSITETLTGPEVAVLGRVPTKESPMSDPEARLIGEHRYAELRDMFYDNNWSFRDFLTFYNNRYSICFSRSTLHINNWVINSGGCCLVM